MDASTKSLANAYIALTNPSNDQTNALVTSITGNVASLTSGNKIGATKAAQNLLDITREFVLETKVAQNIADILNLQSGPIITALDAGVINTGTFNAARVPVLDASQITTGTFKASQIPLLTASALTTSTVGTLGSFYSCSSLTDTAPTLVATGSNTIDGRLKAFQKCNNWAFLKEFTVINSKLSIDSAANANVYVSTSGASGSCFDVIGGMLALAQLITDLPFHNPSGYYPTTAVQCVNSICSLPSVYFVRSSQSFLIPSIPVICTNNICTISATTLYSTNGDSPFFIAPGDGLSAFYNIAPLTIGSIGDSAGSLATFCNYALDH